jgi:ribosome-associated protein
MQMQHIGTLMRKIDIEPVRKAVEGLQEGLTRQHREFHQLEQWRDGIVEGNGRLVEDVLKRFPDADQRRFHQLVRNARKEKREGKSTKSSRSLFRYLKELVTDGQSLISD